jgi:hypothetical protein
VDGEYAIAIADAASRYNSKKRMKLNPDPFTSAMGIPEIIDQTSSSLSWI